MKQIVHILRKDLEHLWPVCLQVWVLVILHAFYLTLFAHPGAGFEIRGPWGVLGLFASLSGLMWPLALAAMTVVLIQQEPLTGSSAFWLTRPYSRVALVTEKVVFVSLCGLAPLVIHYTFAVAWFGFASAAAVPVIAFETCEFAAVLACVAAMAVLTHNFARFTAIASGVIVASWLLVALIDHDIDNGGLLTGVPGLAAAVTAATGAVLVVMHQYKTRRTIANATIGAVSVIAALLVLTHFPWRLAWALHDRIEAPSSGLEQVQLTPILDASDAFLPIDPTGKSTMPVGQSISYPFQVARLTLEAFRAVGDLKIGSRSFHLYPLILPSFRSSTLTAPINKTSAIFSVGPEDILDRYREMSAMLQGSFYFQAYRDLPQRNIPLSQRDITVGVGREKCVVESHLD